MWRFSRGMKSYDEMYNTWELKTRLLGNHGGIKAYKRDKTYYAIYNDEDGVKDIKIPEFVGAIDSDGFCSTNSKEHLLVV